MDIYGASLLKKIRKTANLSRLKQQYKLLFEHFPRACIVCDFDGLIVETNECFNKLMQCEKDDIENESIFKLLHLSQHSVDFIYGDTLLKDKKVIFQTNLLTKTKEIKSVEATFIPVTKNEILIGMYVILFDYTEKRELERSLNQLRENVICGQQLASIGSWTHDLQKDEVFLSEEVYHILGCSPLEFDGKLENYYLCVHPDDLEEVKAAIEDAIEGREYDIEYRIVTPDGMRRYVQEKVKILFDENKRPTKLIGIIQDITKHKLVQNDLKEFGENLNQAQKVAGVGSWKYDVIKDKIYWSEETYRIHGADPVHFKKDLDSFLELVHLEDRIKIQNAVEKCLAGKRYQIEYRILHYNESEKFVVAKGEAVFNEQQQVVGILGTVQDITEKKLLQIELEKNYKNLVKAQHLAHMGSWEMDIAHGKNYMSEEACQIYGITPEHFDGTFEGFLKLVHPEDVGMIHNVLENPPKEHSFDMEFRIIKADGSIRNVYQLMEFTFNKDGKPTFIHGIIQDITEKKKLQERLEYTQETIDNMQRRFQVLVQDSNDVIEIIAPDGTIQYISQAAEKFVGYPSKEIVGKNIFDFVEGKERHKLAKMLEIALNASDKNIKGDIVYKTNLGKEIHFELTMSNLLSEPTIQGIVMNWSDITRRIEMERNMAHIATHDELTKLPNRVYFNKRLKLQCAEAKKKGDSFALIMLDIDEFKYMSGHLGYMLGDQLIIQITQRLKTFLDDKKFICRYSGDQFAIIVSDLSDIKEYEDIAKDIMNLFSHSFKIDMYELSIIVNMGISIYPNDAQNPDSLIKYASIALLRAKDEGKNRYSFYSYDTDIKKYKQFILRNDLHKAIEKNQLRVYYQPQVNLQTSEIIGAEALIRWEHANWGLVPPNEFIYIAEETGFIINLGNWLLREVCRNYKQWLNDGLPAIKVSINYSSIQFLERKFIENIKNIMDEFELNPNFLIIEIVENVLINNFEQVISDIHKLQALGIQVALDDFGTGFSSLEYLNKFNIDIIKIDRSFIKNIPLDKTSTIITRSVINLAQELRIKLVAEGIETWEQLSYLRKLNCYTGQGFLYSKPVPQQDFERLLAKKKCRPIRVNDTKEVAYEERRKFFRIKFPQLLEADMTILGISGEKAEVGNTKVVIKNMGPGGLCFVSNIRLPVRKDIILQFTTELLQEKIKVRGCPVWIEGAQGDLFEYGIEFSFTENERMTLTGVLNKFQIRMRNNDGFTDGQFVSGSLVSYFYSDRLVN